MRGKSTLADFKEVSVCSVSCQTSAFCDVERDLHTGERGK